MSEVTCILCGQDMESDNKCSNSDCLRDWRVLGTITIIVFFIIAFCISVFIDIRLGALSLGLGLISVKLRVSREVIEIKRRGL